MDEIEGWIAVREARYVNVCTVHTVMECQRDARLRRIVNASGLSTPDGMPLVWLSRAHGHGAAGRVYGPDLMLALCERGHRHFLYGGAPGVAEQLATNLRQRFPSMTIAGTHTPPFRAADAEEDPQVLDAINASGADIVWVGLGTPKQDYWVARHRSRLTAPVLIAVGAAFDFHAGTLLQAPSSLQRIGLEWMFRLGCEPRRLWRRYLGLNPRYVQLVVMQALRLRSFRPVCDGPPPQFIRHG